MDPLSPTYRSRPVEPPINLASTTSGEIRAAGYPALVHDVLDPLIPRGSQVALFDFPNHSNVGDSAIWLGEQAYLSTRPDLRMIAVDDCSIRNGRLPPSLPARFRGRSHPWRRQPG